MTETETVETFKIPQIKLRWLRSQDHIPFTRPNTYLILGMRGSGKSSLLEVLAIRYPKIIDTFGCYDEKTEVLTSDGWVPFPQITFNHKIATLNKQGFLEYHKPLAIQKYYYEGNMIHFGGKHAHYDLLVTPDHRMYVQPVWRKDFIFVRAESLLNRVGERGITTYRLKRNADWACRDIPFVELPLPSPTEYTKSMIEKYEKALELAKNLPQKRSRDYHGRFAKEKWNLVEISKRLGVHEVTIGKWLKGEKDPRKLYHVTPLGKIPIDIFLQFLGWYLSEGNVACHGNSVDIAQQDKQKINEICEVVKAMGLKPHIQKNGIRIHNKQLAQYCKQFGHAQHKFIPKWVKNLPPNRLLVLIKTMLKGDGSRNCIYYTSSKQLADDFQEICIKAGLGATLACRPRRGRPKIKGREIKARTPSYEITIAWKAVTPRICTKPKVEYYKGWIYDVTVPNHVLMVRRNGRAVWCGNSSDNEGLCWCKPEFARFFEGLYGRKPTILLIHGEHVEVAAKWDTMCFKDVKLSDFEQYDVITTVHAFYSKEEKYFEALSRITSLLWEKRTHWTEPWFVLIREAANWIYARMKLTKNDKMAKAEFIKSLREARHHGLALGVDTIRWTALDKEVRDVADYIFIKRVGAIGLPEDLKWMYRYVNPFSLMRAKPQAFMLCTGHGAVGFGRFDYPPWHKEEKENILRTTGIEVKRLGSIEPKFYGVSSFEHAEIIKLYLEHESMQKIAKQLGRAPTTIQRHLWLHNTNITEHGQCPYCKRANSPHKTQKIPIKPSRNPDLRRTRWNVKI